ncbi:MAG: C4-dicarboxylate ABC transporter, partial [Candidatus Thermoplasmatota archaeon]|nr:C4-dicarboxylate ABC transporter [Candidatus Thermoplasmatota archaeon]
MRKSILNLFGSEWFGMAISTLALAQVYILAFGETKGIWYNYVAEALSLFGIAIFVVIFSIWVLRAFVLRDRVFSHWNNLTRLSFTALIP